MIGAVIAAAAIALGIGWLAQRLDGDVLADLVAKLEAVGHCFGQAVDAYRSAVFCDGLNALGVGLSSQACNAQRGVVQGRCLGALWQGQPHRVRLLLPDAVIPERGQQAQHSLGDPLADLDQRVVFGDLAVWQAVEAP